MAELLDTYPGIPDHTLHSINLYFREGYRGGDFLDAVLSNDLFKAVGHADLPNREALPTIVTYLYTYCPRDAYGSPAAIEAHCKRCADLRRTA